MKPTVDVVQCTRYFGSQVQIRYTELYTVVGLYTYNEPRPSAPYLHRVYRANALFYLSHCQLRLIVQTM